MTRYLIERVWDPMEEEEMSAKGPLSKKILEDNEQFSPVVWEHSHTVMDEDGQLKSFCVYSSPNTDLIREHARHARRSQHPPDLRDRRRHLSRRLRLIARTEVEFGVIALLQRDAPA